MKRVRKWLLRVVGVAGVLAAAVLAVWVTVLPGVVHRVAVAELDGIGLSKPRLEVRGHSLRHVQVANLVAGEEGRLRAGAVGITYDVSSLSRGHLETIEVTGLEAQIRVRGGVIDFGPLAEILKGRGGEGENFFDRIELRSSMAILDLEGRRLRIPVRGLILDAGAGKLNLDLHVDLQGATLHVAGIVDTNTSDLDLKLTGKIADLGGPLTAVPRRVAVVPGRAGGEVTLEARLVREKGQARVRGALRGSGLSFNGVLGGARVLAEGVSLKVRGALSRGFRVEEFDATVRADELRVGSEAARAVVVELKKEADALTFQVTAEAEDWKLKRLAGKATGVLERISGTEEPMVAEASWALEGRLPARAVAMLRAHGVEVDRRGRGELTGRATVRVGSRDDDGRVPWEVSVPEARASFERVDLRVVPAGVEVRELGAQVRFAGRADGSGLRLEVLPTSQLHAGKLFGALGDWRWALSGDKPAMLSAKARPAELSASLGEKGLAWSGRAPDLLLEFSGGRVEAPSMGMAASGLTAKARLSGSADADKARVEILPGSEMVVGSLSLEGVGVRFAKKDDSQGTIHARLTGPPGVLSISRHEGKTTWEASAPEVGFELQPLHIAIPSAGVAMKYVTASGGLSLSANPNKAALKVARDCRVEVDSTLAVGTGAPAAGDEPLRAWSPTGPIPLLAVEVKKEEGAELIVALDGGEPSWRLRLPRAGVRLDTKSALVGRNRATLERLRGHFSLRADAGPSGATLHVAGDDWVEVQALEAPLGGEILRLDKLRFSIRERGDAPLARLAFVGGAPRLRVAADAKADGPVAAQMGRWAEAKFDALRLTTEANLDAEEVSLRGELVAEGIRTAVKRKVSGGELMAETSGASLRTKFEGRGAARELTRLPLRAEFKLTTTGEDGIRASYGELEASLGRLNASGSLAFGGKGPPRVAAVASFEKGSVRHKGAGLAISDVSARVPIFWNEEARSTGEFTVGSITFGRERLPPLSGSLRVAGWRAGFAATWPLLKGATLGAKGWLSLEGGVPRGELTASIPRFEMGEGNQLGTLVRAAGGLDVRGAFSLDARLSVLGKRVEPRVRLVAENASVASKQWDAALEGVNTKITINSFTPLSTPGDQRIEIRRGHIGELRVEGGFVAFRLESPSSLFIERTEWGWTGGRLYSHALRVNPKSPSIDLVVYADHLKLEEILRLFPKAGAAGEGMLYGRLPVTIRWPKISYGNGFLYAAPGKGWLRMANSRLVGDILQRQDPRFATRKPFRELKERVVSALLNFEYTLFKTDLINEEGRLRARIHCEGKGRKQPQPYIFDVNINDIDEILDGYIIIQRAVGSLGKRRSKRGGKEAGS